jgi:septal ring factor EnvC (AmiA/AmiB activator)
LNVFHRQSNINFKKEILWAVFFLVSTVYAEHAVELHKIDLESQLMQLYEQKVQLVSDLDKHLNFLQVCEKDLIDNEVTVVQSYAQHHKDLKVFTQQLQELMYWKVKRKSSISSVLAHRDFSAKKYLWQYLMNHQRDLLNKQLGNLSFLNTQAQELDVKKVYYAQQVLDKEHWLELLDQQQNEMQQLLEKLLLIEQQELQNSIVTRSSSITFDLNKTFPPLKKIKKRVAKEFLGASIFDGKEGESVVAMANGTVIFADFLKGLGNVIMVEHGQGYLTVYGNCLRLSKKVGELVMLGEPIAILGQSGQIGREALYFEFRKDGHIIAAPHWDSLS